MAGCVGELNSAEAIGEGRFECLNGDVIVIGVSLAMSVVGCVVTCGGRRSSTGGEANCVRFDEVYFKILPNLVGVWLGIPADEGTVVEARALNCTDGLVDELRLRERGFCDKRGNETIFETVKKCLDRINGVPLCVERRFVSLLFRRRWAAI